MSEIVATHWGNYQVVSQDGKITKIIPCDGDEGPSSIGQSLLDAQDPNTRITQPYVREGFLNQGLESDGTGRGQEKFVPVDWDTALELAADSLQTIKSDYGNQAIFGGSYGWASAGRFHHSQGQIHRFLNQFGGYVASRDSYSLAAGHRIIPYVYGIELVNAVYQSVQISDMVEQTELLVCFGGISMKNTQVNASGVGNHSAERQLKQLKAAGVECINVSPIKEDMADFLDAQWLAPRPTTDTALMLGIAHVLITKDLVDQCFIDKYTVGFERFLPYVLGETDGIVKNAVWAAKVCGLPVTDIITLAKKMVAKRTVISIAWSLQRAEHGEQPWWMALVLACMLGGIGLKGQGINFGMGCVHNVGFQGRKSMNFKIATISQGKNPVETYIPVARITDMLLNPGKKIAYNGDEIIYPDIKAIMWAGGNPFHHHQDLNRLVKAWAKPQVVIVNEIYWNSVARHADIVFPACSPLERNDMSGSSTDTWLTPNNKVLAPYGQSKSDYDIYAALADKLGFKAEFTQGLTSDQWLEKLYKQTAKNAKQQGVKLPTFDDFMQSEPFDLSEQLPDIEFEIERFRADPTANPLPLSASGKLEIFSQRIADFGYHDCQGHPMWFEKKEWLGNSLAITYPLHLISNQPKGKLHSQLDHGVTSCKSKVNGREQVKLHPRQAQLRRITQGDIVRVFNSRGSCLAAANICEDIHENIIELPTGSWFDPSKTDNNCQEESLEVHGNPNAVTQDIGSSSLGQGCAAHSCLVNIERFDGELPKITVFKLPEIIGNHHINIS